MGNFRWIGLSEDGDSVVLRRFSGAFEAPDYADAQWFEDHPDLWRVGAVLDLETTGTNLRQDKIIEIGIRLFRFHRETGEVLQRGDGYSSLEDPGEPLSAEIVRITGITDEMVGGQRIDWPRVQVMLEAAHVVVAHNAAFDRPFMDRYLPFSATKVWACSFKQVDWRAKGFPSQKLEVLSIYHGFFNTAHRALADADSLLHLLSMCEAEEGHPYLRELLSNARRRFALVSALHSPIETKDALRTRGYRWDRERRVWSKLLYSDECDIEVSWLTTNVYGGDFRGLVLLLALCDAFKLPDEPPHTK